MEPQRSIAELTRRNVAIIAEMEQAATQVRTRGDRLAERLAAWVGSWTFLVTQTVILVVWVILNLSARLNHWDPYPFILLNLTLACQSAYAAPILMVSLDKDISERAFEDETKHAEILRQIQGEIEERAAGITTVKESLAGTPATIPLRAPENSD